MDTKVLIVEGGSDRKRLLPILAEPVEILCTNGTISPYHIEELLAPYEQQELFVFLDADASGDSIRKLFKQLYPEARHLYTDRLYREVETTPVKLLAAILAAANFKVHPNYLAGGPHE
ncbi:hypothetical protein SporoP37_04640 [Sporosarcina sp. P37]|uniref:hypothetical protein n=1 Tax=unclassified Sporosarcina TaxID=2647733 RepID=UPI0009BE079A|nr:MULTISPECIES: hypothetical protein [unclassified Sporosarcina]ARD47468.1 hypothetical protein SporoP33_03940 [Sporosarcina sp. P33]ARK24038.1 hypothetical protein SporoP37_04640 [Sporosarcina sp. P37]PID18572.1 hypothetical protein CSV62_07945 [Sporosarcina sp. P35]